MTVSPQQTESLQLPSRIENLMEVEDFINRIFEYSEISQEFYGNMLVAVTEAVNNAMKHGNKLDDSKLVKVDYDLGNDLLTFKVRDEGVGFEYDNLPDPTAPENIEKPHGRGVFLMKNLADEVEFHDNGTVVELKFDLSPN